MSELAPASSSAPSVPSSSSSSSSVAAQIESAKAKIQAQIAAARITAQLQNKFGVTNNAQLPQQPQPQPQSQPQPQATPIQTPTLIPTSTLTQPATGQHMAPNMNMTFPFAMTMTMTPPFIQQQQAMMQQAMRQQAMTQAMIPTEQPKPVRPSGWDQAPAAPGTTPPSTGVPSPSPGAASAAAAAPAQPLWPWARSSDRAEATATGPAVKVDDPTVAKDYTSLTMNGLRKIGYAGGPVHSEREAAGIKFGLHRQSFQPKNAPKTINLLVGMEVSVATQLNFPLLDRLRGPANSYLLHIMRQCPSTLVVLQGRGTTVTVNEPLHIRITGTDGTSVDTAKQWADNLILTVRQEYDALFSKSTLKQAAPQLVEGAVSFTQATSQQQQEGTTQYTYSSSYHNTTAAAPAPGATAPTPPPLAYAQALSSNGTTSPSVPSTSSTAPSMSQPSPSSSSDKRARDGDGEDSAPPEKRAKVEEDTYDPEADALSSDEDDDGSTALHPIGIVSRTHVIGYDMI